MKPVHFHPEARTEFDEAIAYYEKKRPGLGQDFLDEVAVASERIQQFPLVAPLFPGTDFRMRVVERFPYLIIYQDLDEFLWIAAVAHAKRRPGY